MSAPLGYVIEKYPIRSWYHLKLFLDMPRLDSNAGDWITTFLEFEDGSTDTITAQYTLGRGIITIDRASYNGVPFFDRFQDNGNVPTYEVVK